MRATRDPEKFHKKQKDRNPNRLFCDRCRKVRSPKYPCRFCAKHNLNARERYDWHRGLPKSDSYFKEFRKRVDS